MFDNNPEEYSWTRGSQSSVRINDECLVRDFMTAVPRQILLRRTRWLGRVARMEKKIHLYMVLVVKPEGKRTLGRPRRRWVDIKMDLNEMS